MLCLIFYFPLQNFTPLVSFSSVPWWHLGASVMTEVSPAHTNAKKGFLLWRGYGLMEDDAAKILQRKNEKEWSCTERMRRTHGGLAGPLVVCKKCTQTSVNCIKAHGSVTDFSFLSIFVLLFEKVLKLGLEDVIGWIFEEKHVVDLFFFLPFHLFNTSPGV